MGIVRFCQDPILGSPEVLDVAPSIKPQVVLADDQPAVLDEIRSVLDPEFDVLATVPSGAALLEAVHRLHPELVVTDISMPGMSGLEAATHLTLGPRPPRIVFLTIHDSPAMVRAAMDAGALGYVVKSHADTDLVVALREALDGRTYICCPGLPQRGT